MDIYIKSAAALSNTRHFDAVSHKLYLGTATDAKGSVVIPEEINDRTGDWLVADGEVYVISSCTPANGKTEISVADPVDFFSRDVFFTAGAANTSQFVKNTIEREFINQSDSEFAFSYLSVVIETPMASYLEPELADDTFNVAEYIKTAVNAGLKVSFSLSGQSLVMRLSKRTPATHVVSFHDGQARLISSQFSSNNYAKCTVRKPEAVEGDEEQTYEDTTYYLGEDGIAYTTPPTHRAKGKWSIIVATQEDDPQEIAEELFNGNSFGYKVEFYSSRRYQLFDSVVLCLPSGNFTAAISEIEISSDDSRYRYQCGQMTTKVSEAVKAVTSTISGEATLGENTTALAAYPIGSIYMSVNSVSPAALFGGTWKQIKGRFLLGCSSDYAAGSTGGEKEHKLTVDEMPAHSHSGLGASGGYANIRGTTTGGMQTGSAGGGQAHNNMPPYIAVYIWERIG